MSKLTLVVTRLGLFIWVLIFIPACSYIPWFGGEDDVVIDPRVPTELTEVPQEVIIQKNWEVSIGGDTLEEFVRINPHRLNERIAFAQPGGKVAVFNLADGRNVWTTDLDISISGGVGGNQQVLVIGTLDGDVVGLQVEDGGKIWEAEAGSEVVAISSVESDVIVARLNDNRLLGIDSASGEKLWTVPQSPPALTLRGANTPIVPDSMVYAGMDNGKVVAISITGNPIWEARVSVPSGRNELQRLVDVDGQIAADQSRVYAASYHGRVVAINQSNGSIVWARDIASAAGLSIDENLVYVTDRDDNVWALEKDSGVSVWKQDGLLYRSVSTPVNQDSVVMVGDFEGYIHILSKEDGRFIGRTRLGKSPIHTPDVGSANVSYISDTEGRLASFTVQ
jgi:outer membrane protein assembly factor BamB